MLEDTVEGALIQCVRARCPDDSRRYSRFSATWEGAYPGKAQQKCDLAVHGLVRLSMESAIQTTKPGDNLRNNLRVNPTSIFAVLVSGAGWPASQIGPPI
jgi:hypothetical protein